MAGSRKMRDKAAEKAVKAQIQKTHLKSFKIIGSEKQGGAVVVYILRMVDGVNYLFKVNCVGSGSGAYTLSGLIPVTREMGFGDYRVYNPQDASIDALRPTKAEKKFKGYNK